MGIYILLVIITCGYFKIKKFKKPPRFFVFKDINNRSGLSLKNPKKGGYEVGVRVRVSD